MKVLFLWKNEVIKFHTEQFLRSENVVWPTNTLSWLYIILLMWYDSSNENKQFITIITRQTNALNIYLRFDFFDTHPLEQFCSYPPHILQHVVESRAWPFHSRLLLPGKCVLGPAGIYSNKPQFNQNNYRNLIFECLII